jgi:hypothetical protein
MNRGRHHFPHEQQGAGSQHAGLFLQLEFPETL